VGHFDIVCRNKNINVHKVTDVSDDEYIGSVITDISALRTDTKSADVYIGSNKLQVLIDKGARVNIMNKSTYLSIPEAQGRLLEPDRTLYPYGANSNPLKIIGRLKVKLKSHHTGKLVRTVFFVIDDNSDNLLSCQTSEALSLVSFAKAVAVASVDNVVANYSDRFDGIGKMKGVQVKLHINTDIKPVEQRTRRVPFHIRSQVDDELHRLEKLDIIEQVEGATPWVSPIVVVHKKTGVRICIDSREVNKTIERERHHVPTIEDLIVDLNGAKFFSKIDLNKGYHQLELASESRTNWS
jgi:hypothetical protein